MHSQIRLIHLLLVTCVISITPIVSPTFSVSAIAQTVSSRKIEADRLLKQGNEQLAKNQFKEALSTLQQALAIYREIEDLSDEGQTLKGIGNIHFNLAEYEKAVEFQQQALAIARKVGDRDLEAKTLNNLGSIFRLQNKLTQSISYYEQSLTVSRQTDNFIMIAITSTGLADLHNSQNDYDKAIVALKEGLVATGKISDNIIRLQQFYKIATSFSNAKDHTQAAIVFRQGLAIAQQLKNKQDTNQLTASIVSAYESSRQYDQLIEFCQQELRRNEIEKDESILLYGIAIAHLRKGNSDQAIEFYQKAIIVGKKTQNDRVLWRSLINLGMLYEAKLEPKVSLFYYEQALEIARKTQKLPTIEQASSWDSVGRAYTGLRNFQKARSAFEESLALYHQLKSEQGQMLAQLGLANLFKELAASLNEEENYPEAIRQADLAIQTAQKISKLAKSMKNLNFEQTARSHESNSYRELGFAYLGLGDLKRTGEAFQAGATLARNNADKVSELNLLASLTNLYAETGEYYKISPITHRFTEIAKASKDSFAQVTPLLYLGLSFAVTGEVQQAAEAYSQALEKITLIDHKNQPRIQQQAYDDLHYALLESLTSLYLSTAEYDKATSTAQEALQRFETASKPDLKVRVLLNLGKVYAQDRNQSATITIFQQAQAIAKQIDRSDLEIRASLNLARFLVLQGNHSDAVKFAQQAMSLVDTAKLKRQEKLKLQVETYSILAEAQKNQGDYAKALQTLKTGIEIEKQIRNPTDAITLQAQYANFSLELGDYRTAKDIFQRFLTTAHNAQISLLEGGSNNALAVVAFLEQNPQESANRAERGLEVLKRNQILSVQVLSNQVLSLAYGELGDNQKAIAAAQNAVQIAQRLKDKSAEKYALKLIGELHSRVGRLEDALASYQTALGIKTATSSTDAGLPDQDDAILYAGIARIYVARNQPTAAIAFYKKAINGIQDTRKKIQPLPLELQKSFLQTTVGFGGIKTSDIYRQFADLLLSEGQVLEAQQVLELLKIQEIREFDRNTRAKISATGELLELAPTERTIVERYGSYISFIQQLQACKVASCPDIQKLSTLREQSKAEYDRYIQALNAESKRLKNKDKENFLDPRNPLSAKAVKLLENRPDAAVVYSLVTDKSIWFVAATRGAALRPFEVNVSREELSKAVGEFRQAMEKCQQPGYVCTTADTTAIQQVSQKLYRWLFPPELRKELPPDRIKHLMFSLDRNIRYIPMSALFDGKSYLIQDYAISTITTADRPENETFSQTVQTASLLAMGASQFPNGLSPLPNVELELKAIVKTNPQDHLGIYSGLEFLNANFNKNNLMNSLPGRNILHLASHGVFSLRSPFESYISLGDRGRLSIPEIRAMTALKGVDLVVLSACQTALGGRENEDGIEIASMGSAFLQNNVKSVMASLWSVDDISTSLLMQQVYQRLAKNTPQSPITRAEALRQAQLQFIEGKTTIVDGNRLRATASLKPVPKAANANPNRTPDFKHPYYWSPFVLMGSGF